jgi:hypothetical protein
MCLIVDANTGSDIANSSLDAIPIIEWLENGSGTIAIGGHLSTELSQHQRLWRKLAEYTRSGACKVYPAIKIEEQYLQIKRQQITSNDIHILALARVSGCRLLFSRDQALSEDFRNRRIIPKRNGQAGRIYRDKRDHSLLYQCPNCR